MVCRRLVARVLDEQKPSGSGFRQCSPVSRLLACEQSQGVVNTGPVALDAVCQVGRIEQVAQSHELVQVASHLVTRTWLPAGEHLNDAVVMGCDHGLDGSEIQAEKRVSFREGTCLELAESSSSRRFGTRRQKSSDRRRRVAK